MNTLRSWFIAAAVAAVASAPALAGGKPDFANPDAVFASIEGMLDACTKAGASDCVVRCNYAQTTLKNFLKANPGGDPGIMQQRWQPCSDAYESADLGASGGAVAGGAPDFSNHDAVVASIKDLRARCNDDAACIKQCDYALKSMKNFSHPQPHFVGLRKGKWEGCRKKVPGAAAATEAPAAAKPDRSRFVVAGLPLGGDMNAHKDRMFLLRAYGWFKDAKTEYAEWVLRKGGATQPGPDLVRNYEGTINEPAVHIFLEATADGSIYKIQFNQKEKMDPDQTKAAVIERYGKPTKRHGNYLSWGCDQGPEAGFCVKANTSAHGLEIWAFDEDVKKAGYAEYDKKLMDAKGVKPGLKF